MSSRDFVKKKKKKKSVGEKDGCEGVGEGWRSLLYVYLVWEI